MRPRPAYPQTERCRYQTRHEGRCRRVATVEGGFCRHHALALELELDRESPLDRLLEIADRAIAGRLRQDQVAQMIGGVVGGWIGEVMQGVPLPSMRPPGRIGLGQAQRPGQAQAPRSRPRPAPAVDPAIEARRQARITLGFEEHERITAEMVKERKRALARVFHPDTGKGSVAHMQRINQAADVLLAGL